MDTHETVNNITLVITGANLVGVITGLVKIWAWTTSIEVRLAKLEKEIELLEGFRAYLSGKPRKEDLEGS